MTKRVQTLVPTSKKTYLTRVILKFAKITVQLVKSLNPQQCYADNYFGLIRILRHIRGGAVLTDNENRVEHQKRNQPSLKMAVCSRFWGSTWPSADTGTD